MINLNNLKRQHIGILEEINFILSEIDKGSTGLTISDLVLHINKLAGKLKIHMMEEDNYLYPDLLKCSDSQIVAMTSQYIKEMGNLANEYTEFKNGYNVGNKINAKLDAFMVDSRKMMMELKNRMEKEDHELYQIIEERKL